MVAIPDAVRTRVHDRHTLHQIAWQTLGADQPATLDYLMQDYVGHLQHHLRQLEALRSRPAARL